VTYDFRRPKDEGWGEGLMMMHPRPDRQGDEVSTIPADDGVELFIGGGGTHLSAERLEALAAHLLRFLGEEARGRVAALDKTP